MRLKDFYRKLDDRHGVERPAAAAEEEDQAAAEERRRQAFPVGKGERSQQPQPAAEHYDSAAAAAESRGERADGWFGFGSVWFVCSSMRFEGSAYSTDHYLPDSVPTGGGTVAVRPADAPLDDSNLGLAMLKGMGWTEGRGLGAGG